MANAPHALDSSASLYPVNAVARAMLPYGGPFLRCLHPFTCNAPPPAPIPADGDWDTWITGVVASGVGALRAAHACAGVRGGQQRSLRAADDPAFANYRCRTGHLESSLLCSACAVRVLR